MKTVNDLTLNEYVNLIAHMPEDESKAKTYCKRKGIDFEDVKTYDWGLPWQE